MKDDTKQGRDVIDRTVISCNNFWYSRLTELIENGEELTLTRLSFIREEADSVVELKGDPK